MGVLLRWVVVQVVLISPLVLSRVGAGASLSIAVNCNGTHIGDITVNTFDGAGGGVDGSFKSIAGVPPSLAAAAAICGEDHFNWYQVVVGDNRPPKDAGGKPVTPPYVDPPPGGYGADPTQSPPFPVLWADNLPWYWNEGSPPPAGTPGYDPANALSARSGGDTLDFTDHPNGPLGTNLLFRTWLVSLNADGSFHEFHGGFTWNWIRDLDNSITITQVSALTADPEVGQYQTIVGGFATKIVPLPAGVGPGVVVVGCMIVGRMGMRRAHKA